MTAWLLPVLAGFCTGILSAWGVGGGTLLLLLMTLFFGVAQADAMAINLLYFLPTAAMGLLYHRKNGLLDRAVLRSAVPWGTAAAAAGALAATAVDTDLLRRPFGIYLLPQGACCSGRKKRERPERSFPFSRMSYQSALAYSGTSTSNVCPSRSTVSVMVSPTRWVRRTAIRSSILPSACPSARSSTSSGRMPISAAP